MVIGCCLPRYKGCGVTLQGCSRGCECVQGVCMCLGVCAADLSKWKRENKAVWRQSVGEVEGCVQKHQGGDVFVLVRLSIGEKFVQRYDGLFSTLHHLVTDGVKLFTPMHDFFWSPFL